MRLPVSRSYRDFLRSRPDAAEGTAVATALDAARETGVRVHILHLSAAGAAGLVRMAREDGVRASVETCPHYLALSAEAVPDGATEFKCCPPIRGGWNRESLWQSLADGTIDASSPTTRRPRRR